MEPSIIVLLVAHFNLACKKMSQSKNVKQHIQAKGQKRKRLNSYLGGPEIWHQSLERSTTTAIKTSLMISASPVHIYWCKNCKSCSFTWRKVLNFSSLSFPLPTFINHCTHLLHISRSEPLQAELCIFFNTVISLVNLLSVFSILLLVLEPHWTKKFESLGRQPRTRCYMLPQCYRETPFPSSLTFSAVQTPCC